MERATTGSEQRVRSLVLELWARTRIDWSYASDHISTAFRKHRELASRERRDVAETLYGMIRMTRRVDFALEHAGAKLPPGPRRELGRYLAYRLLGGELTVEQAAAEVPEVQWGEVATVGDVIARERDAVRRLALGGSLPDWLARRFHEQYGDAAPALADALNQRAPLTVRANRLKTTRLELAAALEGEGIATRPTRFAQDGLILDTRTNAFGLASFKDGRFEVQDEASQLVAELCAPPPRGLVVDFCAGAGGKTLALGALLGGKGRLVALDVDDRKLEELRRRARRAGLHSVRAVEISPEGGLPDEILPLVGKADRVLVDAPCSGIGALRRNPEARWRLADGDVDRLPPQQFAILSRAAQLCAVGGRVIYATCTILADENEAVVQRFLAAHPGYERVTVPDIMSRERGAPIASADGLALATLPHVHDTDGFYAAVLRRRA